MADPVGVKEAADRLGGSRKTVWWWRDSGVMPDPDYESVNSSPAWEWVPLLRWAGKTGRLHDERAIEEFKRRFKKDPEPPRRGGRSTPKKVAKKAAPKKAAPVKSAE